MPTFNRRALRQSLGQRWLRDTLVSTTTGSHGATASMLVWDTAQIDPTASGEAMYQRSWLRLLGSTANNQDVRVGTFNVGSGAFMTPLAAATTVYSGQPYEVHSLLSPTEKEAALDAVVRDVRILQELPLWSVQDARTYSLGPEVLDILDVKYFTDPTHSLNRDERTFQWWRFMATATGQELRVWPTLVQSEQLLLTAILAISLGAADTATINLPTDDWVLSGAAARCYWLLEQRAPGQEAGHYRQRRAEAARLYTRLSSRFQPVISRKLQLDEVW